MKTLVSIIIPIYNTGKYLSQCLDSVCNQTYQYIEILCINDGSSDNSADILDKYAQNDPRIRVITNDKPSGSAAKPRNQGISLCSGEYVVFLDSDDYISTDYIERMKDLAEDKNADLVLCSNYRIDEDGSVLDYDTELYFDKLPKEEVFSYKTIPGTIFQISNAAAWHRLFKRSVILNNGLLFQENVPILDDIFFVNASLLAATRIAITKKRMVFYREGRAGSQTGAIEKHYESVYLAFQKLLSWVKSEGFYPYILISLRNWMLFSMQWWYGNVESNDIARELFYLYRNDYFRKLELDSVPVDEIDPRCRNFYVDITTNNYHPTLKTVLKSNIRPGGRIIVYGAGRHGKKVKKAIQEEGTHEIVLWCDSDYKNKGEGDGMISDPQLIKTCEYDVILITIRNQNAVNDVKQLLINSYNVCPDRIIVI